MYFQPPESSLQRPTSPFPPRWPSAPPAMGGVFHWHRRCFDSAVLQRVLAKWSTSRPAPRPRFGGAVFWAVRFRTGTETESDEWWWQV